MASVAGEKASPARREKFGKFVLLEQVDAANIGVEYRAAKLGSAGLEKIVDLVRLSPVLSANADAAKALMDQAKFAAQLQNANILKIFGIGKVEGSYYISYEFVEGKSLKTIFGRCRSEGFPFSVDHALLIASKICSALEYAHSRKLDGGGRYFHGLVTPGNVVVSYEGEVRLRGFGYWPARVKELGLVGDDEIIYVAPEQASGGAGEPRSDTFAVGAILYEALTGQPLLQADRKQDIALRIQNARLQGPSGDEDALPKQIADILNKALSADPGHRYAEIQEMRKGIDTLLFSGDFTPTTFNLAFFMHSLFREDIERESKVLKDEKEANYFEFLDDVKKTPLPSSESQKFEPVKAQTPLTPAPAVAAAALPLIPPPAPDTPIRTSPPPSTMTPVPVAHREPAHVPHVPPPAPSGMTAKEAAAGLTFHKTEPKSKMPLFAGIGIVVIAGIIGAVMMLGGKGGEQAAVATPAPTQRTPSPEEIAAQQELQRVKDELAQMKAAQEAAAKKADEEARKRLQAEADRKNKQITAEELDKAAAAAAQRAQEEERRKQQQRAKELEEQQRAAEAERLRLEAEAKARADQEKAAAEAAQKSAAAPANTEAPPASAAATSGPVQVGDKVEVTDAGVVAPVLIKKVTVTKPQRAVAAKVTGTVLVAVLVDENGKPAELKLLQKIQHPLGQDCNTAAMNAVKQMEWKPATKDGVRVKTWITAKIPFL
jgi:TonB family protein